MLKDAEGGGAGRADCLHGRPVGQREGARVPCLSNQKMPATRMARLRPEEILGRVKSRVWRL